MNIWDSVQRGLEKASQEAARIAKAQRLRSMLDNTAQQLGTQQGLVITKAMELYLAGKLPPGDLFAACQELHTMHQRLNQLQSDLNQIQSQQNASGTGNPSTAGNQARNQGTRPPAPDLQATQYIPQDNQPSYAPPPFDSAIPPLVPPPPPGMETNSGQGGQSTESIGIVAPPPLVERNHCPTCHVALIPGNAFCHNCGTPVAFAANAQSQQPTVRGGTNTVAEVSGTTGNASEPVGQDEPPEIMDEY